MRSTLGAAVSSLRVPARPGTEVARNVVVGHAPATRAGAARAVAAWLRAEGAGNDPGSATSTGAARFVPATQGAKVASNAVVRGAFATRAVAPRRVVAGP
jgi:hypothetical protein